MHKWGSHARRTLICAVLLYTLLMFLFILDLSVIARAAYGGRQGFLSYVTDQLDGSKPNSTSITAEGWNDTSANGLASTICEILMAIIALRGISYAPLMFQPR